MIPRQEMALWGSRAAAGSRLWTACGGTLVRIQPLARSRHQARHASITTIMVRRLELESHSSL